MRVAYISGLYLPYVGGIEVLLHELTALRAQRGEESVVLCGTVNQGPQNFVDEVDGITVFRLGVNRALAHRDPKALLDARRMLGDAIKEFAPDVVHAHDVGPMLWLYRQTVRSPSAPLAVTMHTLMSRFLTGALPVLASYLRSVDQLTAVSRSVADDVIAIEPRVAQRLTVIPSGVVPPSQLPNPVSVDPPRLLYAGRLIDLKRVDLVVEATARLVARFPALRLNIAGVGPNEADLRAQAAALGIADRVDFLGLVDRDRVFELLEESSAVIMASDFEGLPLVALEAAWMGRPVVAARSPGIVDAVVDGETGYLVDGGDPDALTAALLELLGDPARARSLGAAARALAEREFSLDVCLDRYEALYEQVVAQGPASERV